MLLYVCFFFTMTLLVYALFVLQQERRQRMRKRLAHLVAEREIHPEPKEAEQDKRLSFLKRALIAGWSKLRRKFARRMPEEQENRMELRLLRAGRPFGMGPVEFRLFQIILLVALPVAFFLYGWLLGANSGGKMIAIILGLAAGSLAPSYYLWMKTKQRSRMALRELPDVLDLMTVSLEAGLGFDAAMSKLVSKSHGVLAAEFQRCLEEIRLGKIRREALIGVRDRVPLDELRVLISSILQAERLGIGMVQVLRVQSQEVREQRKQRAEEEAMKAPIKMLFPLVLFIFPCLFIVLLGPAVLQFMSTAFPE